MLLQKRLQLREEHLRQRIVVVRARQRQKSLRLVGRLHHCGQSLLGAAFAVLTGVLVALATFLVAFAAVFLAAAGDLRGVAISRVPR